LSKEGDMARPRTKRTNDDPPIGMLPSGRLYVRHDDASVPVTTRAITQRINRVIRKRGEVLVAARGVQVQHVGTHFVVRAGRGVVERNVDLETYGRGLGVLRDWEFVSDCV
jgi:hypothetical protein